LFFYYIRKLNFLLTTNYHEKIKAIKKLIKEISISVKEREIIIWLQKMINLGLMMKKDILGEENGFK
jgi:hypothetical protein